MLVLTPPSASHVVELTHKLLQQRLLNEKDVYQLFLFSSEPFHKELALDIWQTHVEDVAELESMIRRYGGNLPDKSLFKPFVGRPQMPLSEQIHQALEETGEALAYYGDALKREWPVDVRMMLQKHGLRCKDVLRRLEAAFLPQQHAV